MIIASNFVEVLQVFTRENVEFIIAGGYAVIFHGYGRTTGDLDIWIKSTEENKQKILSAFKKMNYSDTEISQIKSLDFNKPFSFKIGNEPIAIDIFNTITGVKYSDADSKAISYTFSNGLNVKFIHLLDLMTNKMMIGRPKDKADVKELQKINLHSKNKGIVAALKNFFNKKR